MLYHVLSSLDKVMDALKYSARSINETGNNLKKETVEVFGRICSSITGYYELFYNFDFKKVSELYENRDYVIKKINGLSKSHPRKELLILEKTASLLELITDITETRMGMENS